jgi:hypothetical protein
MVRLHSSLNVLVSVVHIFNPLFLHPSSAENEATSSRIIGLDEKHPSRRLDDGTNAYFEYDLNDFSLRCTYDV